MTNPILFIAEYFNGNENTFWVFVAEADTSDRIQSFLNSYTEDMGDGIDRADVLDVYPLKQADGYTINLIKQ